MADINAKTVKRRKDADKRYREDYFYRRHTEEIERQINGIKAPKYVEPVIRHQLEERKKLALLLCDARMDLSREEILQRRLLVIDLMTRLCDLREVQPHHRRANRPRTQKIEIILKEEDIRQTADPFPRLYDDKQCPRCCWTGATKEIREFRFSRVAEMWDHFERNHSGSAQANDEIRYLGLICRGMMHFKNHNQSVHGQALRP